MNTPFSDEVILMKTDWIDDKLHELHELSLDGQAKGWTRIAIVGELVNGTKPRSRDRAEIQSRIAEIAHIKTATQALYARLWSAIKANGGVIPANIDMSTVRCLVEHGASWQVIEQADSESWTLAQAKLWAKGQTVVSEGKPLTRWRHLLNAFPVEWRKSTKRPDEVEIQRSVSIMREALRCFEEVS